MNAKILHILENEGWNFGCLRDLDVSKVRSLDILERKSRPEILLHRLHFDVVHLDTLHVANVKGVNRHGSESTRFRINILQFRWSDRSVLFSSASLLKDINVSQIHSFVGMLANTMNDRRMPRSGYRY